MNRGQPTITILRRVEHGNPVERKNSGNRMTQEANAAGRKATGIHNWADRDSRFVPRESGLTWVRWRARKSDVGNANHAGKLDAISKQNSMDHPLELTNGRVANFWQRID